MSRSEGDNFLSQAFYHRIALSSKAGTMKQRKVRVSTLQQQGKEQDLRTATPAQRLAMVWPLTLQDWSFTGKPLAQSRLSRHTVNIRRGAG